MKRIVVVTPEDARDGFALAGVRQVTAVPSLVPELLRSISNEAETGVVIVDERLVDAEVQAALRRLEARWPGLSIVLPAPGKGLRAEEDYVLRLIRRAIGYQVRLSA
jgi:V/A-type H+-transporting ATPase subunit F